MKLTLRQRLRYAWIRFRLGRDGRRIADEIARKMDHDFLFGP